MNSLNRCPECGANWSDGQTCTDHFHQLGYWELEDLAARGRVHHLMVLSYHLQHPSLYSPDGLREAMTLLLDFLECGMTTEQVRRRSHADMDSGTRAFSIKGSPEAHGTYRHPMAWTMRAGDVVAAGVDVYCASVEAWAWSVLDALRSADALPPSGVTRAQAHESGNHV